MQYNEVKKLNKCYHKEIKGETRRNDKIYWNQTAVKNYVNWQKNHYYADERNGGERIRVA